MWETWIAAGLLVLGVFFGGIWIFRDAKGKGCASCPGARGCGTRPGGSEGSCGATGPR